MSEKTISKEEFIKLADSAIDRGYRKCYIAKNNVSLLFKDGIYFNISGIYKYHNYQFYKIAEITEENLKNAEENKKCQKQK